MTEVKNIKVSKKWNAMVQFIIKNKLFKSGEILTKRALEERLRKRNLFNQFLKLYEQTGVDNGWSFFTYSNRFTSFTKQLIKIGYCERVNSIKYLVLQ